MNEYDPLQFNINKMQNTLFATRVLPLLTLFSLLLLMSGCRFLPGSAPEPTPEPVLGTASEQPLVGQALLTCNQTCADQAQCGEADGLGPVVLLHAERPTLDAHTLIVGTNFPVEIRDHMAVEVRRNGDEVSQWMRFYKVAVRSAEADRGDAWVAGWCIQQ